MKGIRNAIASTLVGAIVSTGIVTPVTSFASEPATSRVVIHDVELDAGKTLRGVVLKANGTPRIGAPVRVDFKGQAVSNAVTDSQGRFQLRLRHGGIHKVSFAHGEPQYCRLWSHGAAPPVAKRGLALVSSDEQVVRGVPNVLGSFGKSTLVVGGVVAAVGTIVIVEATDDGS